MTFNEEVEVKTVEDIPEVTEIDEVRIDSCPISVGVDSDSESTSVLGVFCLTHQRNTLTPSSTKLPCVAQIQQDC